MEEKQHSKLRFNIVSAFVYITGIVLLAQLFNLQIVNGANYREQSNTRLSRESTLEAARGNIRDSSGTLLATTVSQNDLEIYKTKIEINELNTSLLKLAQILEKNGDKYKDNFPIQINPFKFTVSEEEAKVWKKTKEIDENKTAEETFNIYKEKYEIQEQDIANCRKIMVLRYEIETQGYSSTRPVKLANNISEATLHQVSEQNSQFPGINITTTPTRNYPSSSLASHIIGYISQISPDEYNKNKDKYGINDIIGKTGIEYIFEPYLKGTNGIKQIDMAVDGTVTDEYISKEAIAGCDVILTIDANLQKVTEQALKNNIEKIRNGGFSDQANTTGGSAVVMNIKTGEILSMASYPEFNPQEFVGGISNEKWNEYTKRDESNKYISAMTNRAISSLSAPGSTFKMATAIAALETGKLTTKEKIKDTGIYHFSSDYNPRCWIYKSTGGGHGYLNVSQAIQHSCNYFFYELGNRLGDVALAKYAKYLGLGRKTGVELLGEVEGTVACKETSKKLGSEWAAGNVLSAAIGQENNQFTPIQMAKYTSMIVNGGKDIDVTILKSIVDANGNEIPKEEVNKYLQEKMGISDEKQTEDLSFKKENVQAILEGMRGVTSESGGTAYSYFKGFNIEVGGKTGSAQTGNDAVTNAWFVGFAPFDNPEIAVIVMVENGQHGGYTAEVARDIIAEYFGMNATKVTEDMTAKPNTEIQN